MRAAPVHRAKPHPRAWYLKRLDNVKITAPRLEELPSCKAPIAESGDSVTLRVRLAHLLKHRQRLRRQPLITFVRSSHRQYIVMRLVEEACFQPARRVPRVERDNPLKIVAGRQLATKRLIEILEIFFVALVCFFKPSPAQDTARHGDRRDLHAVIHAAEKYLLPGRDILKL